MRKAARGFSESASPLGPLGLGQAEVEALPRQPIGPGTYNLIVQLGNLRSAAVPFILAAQPGPAPGAPPADPNAVPPPAPAPVG